MCLEVLVDYADPRAPHESGVEGERPFTHASSCGRSGRGNAGWSRLFVATATRMLHELCDTIALSATKRTGSVVFLFFSNKLGCLGSILVSVVITGLIILLFRLF